MARNWNKAAGMGVRNNMVRSEAEVSGEFKAQEERDFDTRGQAGGRGSEHQHADHNSKEYIGMC